ncbi:DsbE family thiol:disulfide interchange protein [Sphingomicrobium marinum]|uniref:DsbE family thiol:disulfide interchange protein n=1 Tax=Sphingomicrobium marinum TaxID=1227950 RepID=UPI00224051B9|nr:DsbE family thiol:disulfide interchange protein [Sphingomicrobium marinum]
MTRFIPIIIFFAIIVVAGWRLAVPREEQVRSTLVGQPAPEFALKAALEGKPGLSTADLATGQPRLVNIFASWCVPCIAEAPLLDGMAKSGIPIDGIAVRDKPEDIARFLARHGDPFDRLGNDLNSAAMIAFGASGVPETFVVNGEGMITYHHQGPLLPDDVPRLRREWKAAR